MSETLRQTCKSYNDYFSSLGFTCNPGEPAKLVWTPDNGTPDLVYYQVFEIFSFVHQAMLDIVQHNAHVHLTHMHTWCVRAYIIIAYHEIITNTIKIQYHAFAPIATCTRRGWSRLLINAAV